MKKFIVLFAVSFLFSNIALGQSTSKYKSPISGDTITINGIKYNWRSIQSDISLGSKPYIFSMKGGRKRYSEIRKAVDDIWNALKSGRVTYHGSYFTDHDGYFSNISGKDKNDYMGLAAGYLGHVIEKAEILIPKPPKPPRTNYLPFNSESEIKKNIDQNNDGICGIYELESQQVACVKYKGSHYIICTDKTRHGQVGDIVATLQMSASNILKAEWREAGSMYYYYITFDGAFMNVANDRTSFKFLKMYPTKGPSSSGSPMSLSEWTGTGFALRDGYVVTNYHVVNGASSISVVGVNGSSTELKAGVVAVDSKNDLALIKINDSRFYGFGSIPYSVKNTVAEVGADVFVLGYPLTQYMGEEIKLTNGIISSRSGYQGDVTTYQISAPIQPGNSGGPMFDKIGNVIGIVNAGIPNAENVGYAIKTSYLLSLITSQVSSSIVPTNNTLSGMSLTDKVRVIRNYVFQIKCH